MGIVIFAVLSVVALVIAVKSNQRLTELENQVEILQQQIKWLPYGRTEVEPPVTEREALREEIKAPAPEPVAEKISSPVPPQAPPTQAPSLLDLLSATEPPRATTPPTVPKPAPAKEKPASSLEETLGTRLTVWIGAIALALAGAYLVKYSFDQNLLTPAIRIAIGLAFGVALLGVGEWLRTRSARVAEGATAAGIADLFACLLAATNLYDLISPMVGFAAMTVVTALAVGLSLRQGPFVALLGLAGGFLTPVLIQAGEAQPSLLAYLFIVQLGLLGVTRHRGWWHIASLTLAATMIWSLFWLVFLYKPDHSLWLGLFLLGTTLAFFWATQLGDAPRSWGHVHISNGLMAASAVLSLLLLGGLVGVSKFSTLEWAYLGLMGAGCFAIARINPVLVGLSWLAAGATFLWLAKWGYDLPAVEEQAFWITTTIFGVLYAGGAYALLWNASDPVRWAALSGLTGIAYFMLVYATLVTKETQPRWAIPSGGLAVVYAIAAIPLFKKRQQRIDYDWSLSTLAVSVVVFISAAVPMAFDHEWVAIAWAAELPLLALCEPRLRLSVLRWLAGPLLILALIRLFVPPLFVEQPLGVHVLANWAAYGYGLPLIACALAAYLFRKTRDDKLVEGLEHTAILLGLVWVLIQVRQYFHPNQPASPAVQLAEWGVISIVLLLYGLGLLAADARWRRAALADEARLMIVLGCVQTLFAQIGYANPLWNHESVGAIPIFNLLLALYGAPAALALLLTAWFARLKQTMETRALGVFSLLLIFVLVSMQVRHLYQGEFLDAHTISSAERYTYSAAWILLGILLLVIGIVWRGTVVRYASLVVMLLAVAKVFLYDTAHLRDLYRVFSFLGLGISLLLLGYLYQRFVFTRATETSNTDEVRSEK